tara:strand:- start:34082 stop:34228 length:147 start_codon:yes stop_codon:yes gene_type:complete
MKAKISKWGFIQIIPENDQDQYILIKWKEDNTTDELRGSKITIIDNIE